MAATVAPASTDNLVTIRNGHTVTISSGTITTDQTVVEVGGTLAFSGGTLSLNNGTGEDLAVNGTFTWYGGIISGAGSAIINTGATCALGNPANQAIGALQTTFTNNGMVNMVNNYFFSCCSPTTFDITGGTINNNGVFNVDTYSD